MSDYSLPPSRQVLKESQSWVLFVCGWGGIWKVRVEIAGTPIKPLLPQDLAWTPADLWVEGIGGG